MRQITVVRILFGMHTVDFNDDGYIDFVCGGFYATVDLYMLTMDRYLQKGTPG